MFLSLMEVECGEGRFLNSNYTCEVLGPSLSLYIFLTSPLLLSVNAIILIFLVIKPEIHPESISLL